MTDPSAQQFPAAVRVVQALQSRIAQGSYAPGAWLPTERELAQEFAVSRPVIRAALSYLIEQGQIHREPGCRPRVYTPEPEQAVQKRAARSAAPTALKTIAAVLPQQPTYALAQAILRGISQELQQKEAPFRLTIFDTHIPAAELHAERGKAALERSLLEQIAQEGSAGIILWHMTGALALPTLRQLQERGLPMVFIDRYPEELDCDYVGVDNRRGVREAVEYLMKLGHRRIAYLTNSEQITTVRERREGYREAFLAQGLLPLPELTYVSPMEIGADMGPAATYLLSLPEPPTAVVADNDLHAFAFIREAQKRGWRVPEDISVIGFDDIESYSPHPATLTTVHQPFYQIGQRATDLLLRRLAASGSSKTRVYQHVVLATSLVIRSTCRPLE